jgi:hypothetical protein
MGNAFMKRVVVAALCAAAMPALTLMSRVAFVMKDGVVYKRP